MVQLENLVVQPNQEIFLYETLPPEYQGILRTWKEFTPKGISRTIAHEIGHLLGLSMNNGFFQFGDRHSKDKNNLMYPDTDANDSIITKEQRNTIVKTVSKEQPSKKERKELRKSKRNKKKEQL